MIKTILFAPFILGLLGGVARADSTYAIELSLQAQHYTIFVVDNNCGEVSTKTAVQERTFRVCAAPGAQNRVRLDVERRTRDQADEVHSKASLLMTPGSSYNLDDLKLSLKVQ